MKTAEEMLREVYSPSDPYGSAVIAMEDFAAQEVDAYKERLKAELRKEFADWYYEDIKKIIDTTK